MPEVSLLRLNILRAVYLMLLVMIPQMTAARMLFTARSLRADDGWAFTACLLGALAALAALGLRHPLKMLPLLVFEIVWKALWLTRIAAPLWVEGRIDDALVGNTLAAGLVVLVIVAVPWRYAAHQYLRRPGAPRRGAGDAAPAGA